MKKWSLFAVASLFIFVGYAHAATRTLVVGTSGSDVVALQTALISKGYMSAGRNTGYFGTETLAAVKKFQCDAGVVCSGGSYGVVGPLTQAALAGSSNTSSSSSGTTPTVSQAPATGPLEFGGWLPYWHAASSTADVAPHLSQMTEVSPFEYTVNSAGLVIDGGNIDAEPWTSFIAQAKASHVRVIPTVMWGDGVAEQNILSNSTTRIALEDQIANIVQLEGFDGIDIDFEAKEAQTKDYFSTFLKGLYQRMGNKWVYCSIEARMPLQDRYGIGVTPPADATEYANDYVAINKYCDRVEIMAYDQGQIDTVLNAARAAPYVPVADPAWVENIVNLAAQTISKKKILIGVPTYGYEYQVNSSGSGYQYNLLWAFNPNYATQLASLLGITPSRNSADELSFLYKSTPATQALSATASLPGTVAANGNTTAPPTDVYSQTALASSMQPPFNIVWWSDAQAISDKVALAKQLGVRGIAVFQFNGAEDQNIWNVLK
jgi:spore germination protein YaaH